MKPLEYSAEVKALNNMNNISSVMNYLKSKDDSEQVIRKLVEISVYCNELEVAAMDFSLERFPRSIRIRMAMRIHDYVRNWLIANRKI